MPVGLYCRSAREPNWLGFDDSDEEVAADTNRVDLVRVFLCARLTFIVSIILTIVLSQLSWAGGPRYVAGVSYFDAGTKGVPLTWAQGAITYYTDQGNLSPALPGPGADALVADAFSQWTSIATAAVSATHAG